MPTLRINDLDVDYDVAGEGEAVLLVHGLGSSRADWAPQIAALARRHRVIAYDQRGHGGTSKPRGPYTMAGLAADAAALVRALGAAPVHVIGLSLGGMVAFQLAVDAPALVRSLVIVNSGPEVVPRTFAEKRAMWTRRALLRVASMRTLGRVLSGKLFPRPEQAALRETFVARWAQNDKRAYRATLDAIVGWSVRDRIAGIDRPTLVISGDRDYTPVAHKQAYVALMPRAELVTIADSGHATTLDQPERVNQALLEFLARAAPAGQRRDGDGQP